MEHRLCLGTRFWGKKDLDENERLLRLAERASKWNVPLIIATDDRRYVGELIARAHEYDDLYDVEPDLITVLGISPWINFTIPMNYLIHSARSLGNFNILLSISLEIDCSLETIKLVMSHIDKNTLVAGAALPGHDFSTGYKPEATGTETPWNAFAAWNLDKISRIGFTLAGDALWNRADMGVEEVASIAIMQKLFSPDTHMAKLIEVGEIEWQVDFKDNPERRERHIAKMKRKRYRPSQQLLKLNLDSPYVQHISMIA